MLYFFSFLILFFILFFLSRKLTRSISFILFKLTKNQELSIKIFHFLFFPGVLIHELSHLISAEVMFVRTHGLRLMPERNGDELVMGSVQIEKTDPIRRALIGFAPVLVGFTFITVGIYFLLSDKSPFEMWINYFLIFLLVFEIGNTMFSSKRDLEGTIELLIFFTLVIGTCFIFGVSFQPVFDFINSLSFQEILSRGIKILLIPIFVDAIIILTSRILISNN